MRRLIFAILLWGACGNVLAELSPEVRRDQCMAELVPLLKSNEFEKALPWMRKLLDLQTSGLELPNSVLFFAGQTFAKNGMNTQGAQYYERYIAVAKGEEHHWEAIQGLANINQEQALPMIEDFLKIVDKGSPDYPEALRAYTRIQDELERARREKEELRQRRLAEEQERERQRLRAIEEKKQKELARRQRDTVMSDACMLHGGDACQSYRNEFARDGQFNEKVNAKYEASLIPIGDQYLENKHHQEARLAYAKYIDAFPYGPQVELARGRQQNVACQMVGYLSGDARWPCLKNVGIDPKSIESGDGYSATAAIQWADLYLREFPNGKYADWIAGKKSDMEWNNEIAAAGTTIWLGYRYMEDAPWGLSVDVVQYPYHGGGGWGGGMCMRFSSSFFTGDGYKGDYEPEHSLRTTNDVRAEVMMVDFRVNKYVYGPLWFDGSFGLRFERQQRQWVDGTDSLWFDDLDFEKKDGPNFGFGAVLDFSPFGAPIHMRCGTNLDLDGNTELSFGAGFSFGRM